MGDVLLFNRKSVPIRCSDSAEEPRAVNVDAWEEKGGISSQNSKSGHRVQGLHRELNTVVTLLEAALKEISPLIEAVDGLKGDDKIRKALALARLEVECAKFSVSRLDDSV